MGSVPPLLSFLRMAVSGWVYRHQLIVTEFLQMKDRLLKGRLQGKRMHCTDGERALLTRKAKAVWRKTLVRLGTIVSPDTLRGKRYLIIDRDTKYTDPFRRLVREAGTGVIRLPPMSPNVNAYAERFVRWIKEACLNRMIVVGQASLRRAVTEYTRDYHAERNHQGLGNRLIRLRTRDIANDGQIRRRQRLGGMLSYYYRQAA